MYKISSHIRACLWRIILTRSRRKDLSTVGITIPYTETLNYIERKKESSIAIYQFLLLGCECFMTGCLKLLLL